MGVGVNWELIAKGCRVSFEGNKNSLKLIVVTTAQFYDYTKTTCLYAEWVNCMISELYLNKVITPPKKCLGKSGVKKGFHEYSYWVLQL